MEDIDVEGSGRTFFDKKALPLGFLRTTHKNSKVTLYDLILIAL